ncbi:class I SAM-dependent methyltransferase [Rhodocytophaga rosea]|uniref:Class I SAM-dependent methyltransferase n=1 Tax=Rhodocytophaga rosea TaxID=2704465 RepID=A0A6C0GJQ7_9BACT|nr:class I SAM-dependent methyltransferase [Rhodocytophaga rosea]QHT68268.1 class I SAM-dependent methyltransferase [Rhodocytophaga rosea]
MKPLIDNFSAQSAQYLQFRPVYPQALLDFVITQVHSKKAAWDCGTGNGQVAIQLASSFGRVSATDISAAQLSQAPALPNLTYLQTRAEQTPFEPDSFDLITVAQAIHWFDFERFYQEVNRTGRKGGILAVWGYGLLQVNPEIDRVLMPFYKEKIGPYWDKERKYIDDHYQTIPFPFREIQAPTFAIQVQWDLSELTGYLQTWSSVQKYIFAHGENPVQALLLELRTHWLLPEEKKQVTFPLFMRIGYIDK